MGETIFNDFVKHCRVDSGYAALSRHGHERKTR